MTPTNILLPGHRSQSMSSDPLLLRQNRFVSSLDASVIQERSTFIFMIKIRMSTGEGSYSCL